MHKTKLQTIFANLTENLTIKTTFHLMAAYSPKLNLVVRRCGGVCYTSN